jgi:hypothetical protein
MKDGYRMLRKIFMHGRAGGIMRQREEKSFRFVVLPSSTYLFTVGVEVVYFHLITLRHTPQSVGLLWTRDRPDAETST